MRGNQNCGDGNRSSVSSEGFCENDDDILNDSLIGVPGFSRNVETDSQEGGSDSNSSSVGNNLEGTSSGNRSGESSQESGDCNLKLSNYDLSNDPNQTNNGASTSATQGQSDLVNSMQKCTVTEQALPRVSGEPEVTRRASKDDSVSSSESQQSGDECSMYYYDAKHSSSKNANRSDQDKYYDWCDEKTGFETYLRLPSDAWEILFARAEGLYAHGHSAEARRLGVRLARELLARPPELVGRGESPGGSSIPPRRKGRRSGTLNPASHKLSVLASATLARCAFLCTVSLYLLQ